MTTLQDWPCNNFKELFSDALGAIAENAFEGVPKVNDEMIPHLFHHGLEPTFLSNDERFTQLFSMYEYLYDTQFEKLKSIKLLFQTLQDTCVIQGFPLNRQMSGIFHSNLKSDIDVFVPKNDLRQAEVLLRELGLKQLGFVDGKLISLDDAARQDFAEYFDNNKQACFSLVEPFTYELPEGFEFGEIFGPLVKTENEIKFLFSIELTTSYGFEGDENILKNKDNRTFLDDLPINHAHIYLLFAVLRVHNSISRNERPYKIIIEISRCLANLWSNEYTSKLLELLPNERTERQVFSSTLGALADLSPQLSDLVAEYGLPARCTTEHSRKISEALFAD